MTNTTATQPIDEVEGLTDDDLAAMWREEERRLIRARRVRAGAIGDDDSIMGEEYEDEL